MKKVLGVLLLSIAGFANAGGIDCRSGVDHKHPACYGYHNTQHRHNQHHHGHRHNRHDWVAPVILGGVVTYILTRPQELTVVNSYPQQVINTTPQNCTPWREYYQSNGTIVRERTCW